MKELKELSINYATEKTNEVMFNTIAQAYADGYRKGYKDREDEIPVNLRDGNTEYVDLGLPSGTLWSNDYEKMDEKTLFLTYEKAEGYSLPSVKQCEELFSKCRWTYTRTSGFTCIGPNGNIIRFRHTGFMKIEGKIIRFDQCYMWLSFDDSGTTKKGMVQDGAVMKISDVFMGYRLPVRLVKNK
jgi:hypothetical protein